jgi:eukaryotic-like serine/threonine-protein kinase
MFELTELGDDRALIGERYRLERFVARGGMGQIYAATDTWLGERVAVKLPLADELNHVVARHQLSREARLTRRVQHPGVCRIHGLRAHECGEDSTPMPFLAMDFVEGERLGQRLRQGRLPLGEVAQIARQLLSALAAVHEARVCHLDLKSDNIILAGVGGSYRATIVDFGLARDLDPHAQGSLHAVAGTPAYMAPEQVFGAAPNPASDVYAFGILLFEMLTGQLPFLSCGGSGATLLQRLHQVAPAPSSLVAELPEAWDELVQRCLKLQPGERYPDAGGVLAAFDGLWLDAPAAERARRDGSQSSEPPLSTRRLIDTLPEQPASGLGSCTTLPTTTLPTTRRYRAAPARRTESAG